VDEGHRPDACRGTGTGAVFAQILLRHAQKFPQGGALRGRITLLEAAAAGKIDPRRLEIYRKLAG